MTEIPAEWKLEHVNTPAKYQRMVDFIHEHTSDPDQRQAELERLDAVYTSALSKGDIRINGGDAGWCVYRHRQGKRLLRLRNALRREQ